MGSQVVLNIGLALVTVHIPPYIMPSPARERPHALAAFAAIIPATALVAGGRGPTEL